MKKVMKKHICIALVAVLFTGLCLGAAILTGNAAPTAESYFEDFESYKEGVELPNYTNIDKSDLGLYWATPGKDSFAVSNEQAKNGSKAGKIVTGNNQKDTGVWLTNSLIKRVVTKNETYELSFWYYSTAATKLHVCYGSGKGKVFEGKNWADIKANIQIKANEWTYVSVQFEGSDCMKYVNDSAYDAFIVVRSDKSAGTVAYIDDISLCTTTPEVNEYDGLYVENFEGTEHAYGNIFWNLGTASVTDEKAYAGNKALKYVYASSDGSDHSQGSPYLDPAMLKKVVTKTGTYKFSLYAYFTGAPDKVTAILRTENKTFADKQWGKSLTIDEVSKNADEWNKLVFTLEVDDEILARVQAPETYGLKLCLDNFCLKSGTTYFDNIVFGIEDKIPAEPTPTPGVTPTPTPDYTGCYFEDLEDGNTAYGNVFWNLGTATVTNEKAYSGKKSLKYVYAKSTDGADHSQGSPYLDPEMLKKVVTKTGTYNFELYAYFTETPDKLTAILRTENKTFSDKQWGRSLTAVEVGKEANKWNKIVFTLEVDDEILARIQDPETYGLKLCLDNFCLQSGTTYFDDIAFGTPEKIEQARSNSEHSGDYGYFGLAAVIVLAAGAAIIIKKKSERV